MAALDNASIQLKDAVVNGDVDTVMDLLNAGVDPNFTVQGGCTPLIIAASEGHSAIVHALLAHGANVDAELTTLKQSSLHLAACYGHYEITVDLLQNGATINAQDWTGATPLLTACHEGRVQCAQLLIHQGADMEMAKNDGMRPLGVAAWRGQKDIVELLVRRGAGLDEGANLGGSALMLAARSGEDECISILLANGAQADLEDINGDQAVSYAINENLGQTALLLLPNSNISGHRGPNILNTICKMGMESVAEKFLEMLRSCDETKGSNFGEGWKLRLFKSGLEAASEFGEEKMAQMILKEVEEEEKKTKLCNAVLKLAVESDQGPIVDVITRNISKITSEIIQLATTRKVPAVNDVLMKTLTDKNERKLLEKYTTECLMKKAKQQMKNIGASTDILAKVPKSDEVSYFNINNAFADILVDDRVEIDTAIRSMRAPQVHLEGCTPNNCHHHDSCRRFIESKRIIDDVLDKLGDEIAIFKGTYGTMVGSIIENTRIGRADEIDTLVQLKNSLVDNFVFDENTQEVTVNFANGKQEMLAPYTGANNIFNGHKFYQDYIKAVHKIMHNYIIPDDCPLSQESLHISTTYDPCPDTEEPCVDIKFGHPTMVRCKHTDSNRPTVCHSKVGIVLHFGWRVQGEWIHRIDIDLTCPKIPTRDRCNGTVKKIQQYLRANKFVGWLEEYNKLTSTEEAGGALHLAGPDTIWLVQMRKINNQDVIPRQMIPFMNKSTLKGSKLELYILLKILKHITDAKTKSFNLKFSVNTVFGNSIPDRESLGDAAIKILNYKTLRGKFCGIHPELETLGYSHVDLDCLREGEIKLIRKEESNSSEPPADDFQQVPSENEEEEKDLAGCYSSSIENETRVEDCIPSIKSQLDRFKAVEQELDNQLNLEEPLTREEMKSLSKMMEKISLAFQKNL